MHKLRCLGEGSQQVLVYLLEGLSYEQIAGKIDKSEGSVRQAASRIFKHYGIDGRHGLIKVFVDKRLLRKEIKKLGVIDGE